MFHKPIHRLVLTFFASSMLFTSPYGVEQASAISNLMELFSRKPKTQTVYEAPAEAVIPLQPKQTEPKKTSIEQIKRVTVLAPKTYDYKPERQVPIDFSNVDFIATNSTIKTSSPAELPLSDPYNVILEGVNSETNDRPAHTQSSDFSRIDVKVEKSIADAVTHYYAHNPQLLWSKNGEINEKAADIMQFFAHVDEDGLEPLDYFVKIPDKNNGEANDALAFTNFDVALTSRILRFVEDASNGRIIANQLSAFHDLPRTEINLADELNKLAKSDTPVEDLKTYFPQSGYYKALKHALAQLPKAGQDKNIRISNQTVIKPGENNNDLPLFTELLLKRAPSAYLNNHKARLTGLVHETVYGDDLVGCVKDYQNFIGKAADGIIGPATISSLKNDTVNDKRQKIIDSMERLRWLPHNFGDRFVLINQAAFRAQYVEKGDVKLDMKVVVGSPQRQTYFFYDRIRLVTFNPSWGVPNSIVVNEMLPRIMQDTGYLQRNNYQLYDSSGRPVSASSVNWQQVASKGRGISVRQTPGKNNALGELKILFPNKHDIYMHDTPNKTAFSRDMRALSHGCVRLEYPREMAAAVLGKSVDELKPYFAKGERSVSLSQSVPVYLTYFTAWPDLKTGKINYYGDIYSRDELMAGANEKTDSARDVEM